MKRRLVIGLRVTTPDPEPLESNVVRSDTLLRYIMIALANAGIEACSAESDVPIVVDLWIRQDGDENTEERRSSAFFEHRKEEIGIP